MNNELKRAILKKISKLLDRPVQDAKIQIDYHFDTLPAVRYDITEYISMSNEVEDYKTSFLEEPEWISVSDTKNIPEFEVLACDKYGEMTFGYLSCGGINNNNWTCENHGILMYDVVAWMPKPKPYRKEDN